jgi:hypothetical protein
METYTTLSLNIAAYLKCNGIEIIKVEKSQGKAIFHFKKTPEVKVLVDMYLNDKTLKRFISTFKEVKDIAVNA